MGLHQRAGRAFLWCLTPGCEDHLRPWREGFSEDCLG